MIGPSIRRAAITTAALLSALTLAVTQAEAASIAYHTRTMWLTSHPTESTSTACVDTTIYLAEGNYSWVQTRDGRLGASKTIWLRAGTYGWLDCLWGKDGYYKHWTNLSPQNNDYIATLYSPWVVESDGNYTWGSYLNPDF
ncbi:hypothetical protein J7E97_30910 [Streptomyces sp. ISL-66]|uniref:hypothetical protein n=1 Tax=Streptomyces sp. ISL-66 TaxID=2819186 RepID=UPI001BEA0C3C|nr:hypothetical protein [Streptomyces sp. ISL-66]MBT2472152.1 hypothetical protein [Streptomyces sp. ISL-66]